MFFKETTITFAISLLSLATASPLEGRGRYQFPDSIDSPPPAMAMCALGNNYGFAQTHGIWLPKDYYSGADCGNGVLDNLRGRCAEVMRWGCTKYDKEGRNIDPNSDKFFGQLMAFTGGPFCDVGDVAGAIDAATGGKAKPTCEPGDDFMLPPL